MATTTRKRLTQEERSRISTEKLIEACLELASEKGATAITFDMIGERAGYSRNLAFQKFGSKSALIEAVIDYLHRCVTEARNKANLDELNGLDAIHAFCETQFSVLTKGNVMRAYSILLGSAIGELSDALTLFEEANRGSGRLISKLLRRGIADGSIRQDIGVDRATLLIGSQLIGISAEAIVEPDFDTHKALDELKDVIVRAYGNQPAPASGQTT